MANRSGTLTQSSYNTYTYTMYTFNWNEFGATIIIIAQG